MSDLKAGDVVWLKCTVEKVYGDSFVIAESWFHLGEEEHVSPAPVGEECPECFGTGTVSQVLLGDDDEDNFPCDVCGGTGVVSALIALRERIREAVDANLVAGRAYEVDTITDAVMAVLNGEGER